MKVNNFGKRKIRSQLAEKEESKESDKKSPVAIEKRLLGFK